MKRTIISSIVFALLIAFSVGAAADEGKSDGPSGQDAKQVEKAKKERPRMDVVFAIDATGSMGDEIDVIKKEVWNIANELMTGKPAPDIRFGLVLYRDKSDSQLIEATPLTRNVDKIHEKLMAARAMGGGDNPEHVGKGLHTALDMEWDMSKGVAKKIYLVGDAPAKSYQDNTLETAISKAQQKGVKISAIGGSGIEAGGGKAQFAMIAKRAGGTFEALTYFAVVEEPDGSKKSVVYHDGKTYEAEGEITEEEWKEGAAKLVEKKDMKVATGETRRRARSAKKKNNLDKVVEDDMKSEAMDMGVAY
jgi:Mg-chelatase subunit ChlD